MSLAGLDELDLSWTLQNSLTINNDVEVIGDLNSSGFVFDGGIPITITGNNNVWTGNNSFPNFQPTFLAPVSDEDMATFDYMDTAFTGLGASLLPLDNNWTGANSMTDLPTITNAATAATNEAVNLSVLNTYLPTTSVRSKSLDGCFFSNKNLIVAVAPDASRKGTSCPNLSRQ